MFVFPRQVIYIILNHQEPKRQEESSMYAPSQWNDYTLSNLIDFLTELLLIAWNFR